jgi:hypothetical protein
MTHETPQALAHELFAHECFAFTGEGRSHSYRCQQAAERLEQWRGAIQTLGVRLEARPADDSEEWTEIFPVQLEWVVKQGHQVRAIETVPRPPLVCCPVCGGEAIHALDVLARTVIKASPEYDDSVSANDVKGILKTVLKPADVRVATHVKVGDTMHKIVAKWGIDLGGHLAKPSDGGFGVVTESGERIGMFDASSYWREQLE